MNANSDDITGLNLIQVHLLQRFVYDDWVTVLLGSRASEDIEPSRRDDCRAERAITRVNEEYAHEVVSEAAAS